MLITYDRRTKGDHQLLIKKLSGVSTDSNESAMSDELIQAAMTVTRILYRDGHIVLRDPVVRSHVLKKIARIKRSIGEPQTEDERALLTNIANIQRLARILD